MGWSEEVRPDTPVEAFVQLGSEDGCADQIPQTKQATAA